MTQALHPISAPPAALEAPPDLQAQFPALASLLGPAAFARLSALAGEHSAAQGVAPDSASGVPAGAFVHGLLVHGDVPAPDGTPARLLADVAALEWAVAEVSALAPRAQHEPRLTDAQLEALAPAALAAAALRPTRALRLVPCAFRLAGWLRDVHEGKQPHPPRRGEQHVAVYALPALLPGEQAPVVWWTSLSHAEGRVLARAALGTPLGTLRAEAVERGWVRDEAMLMGWLRAWVREGLFAGVEGG
jgi:hypothetical protein